MKHVEPKETYLVTLEVYKENQWSDYENHVRVSQFLIQYCVKEKIKKWHTSQKSFTKKFWSDWKYQNFQH